MRSLKIAGVVAAGALALTACGPTSGGGRASSPEGCVDYSYSNVSPPTAETVIPVTIRPCSTSTTPPVTTTTTTVPPAITTTIPPTTTSPPAGGEQFPNAASTGAASGTQFVVINGNYTASAGERIENKRITGGLTIGGDNVTVVNSEVYGTITNGSNRRKFALDRVTVGAPTGCNGNVAIQFDNYTAKNVKVRSFGDAFRGSSAFGVSNILVQDSYALLCANAGDHSDGYQGYQAGTNVVLRHNTIDQSKVPNGTATAPVFNSDGSQPIIVENNLLLGGSFTIRVDYGRGGRSVVKDNRVVNGSWQYGPVSSSCSQIDWTGNTLVNIDSSYRVTNTVRALACA